MKSILDPSFRYTTSYNTDLKKTFARIRCARQASNGITSCGEPTVDGENHAARVRGAIGGEEHHRVGDFLRRSGSP